MIVQNVRAYLNDSKIVMMWELMDKPVALSIQVANDADFTTGMRTFIIPVLPAVGLDIGAGTWYFRVGSWVGTETIGKILWTPVHGPVTIESVKLAIRMPDVTLPVIHTSPIVNGYRIHTGIDKKTYYVYEHNTDSKFPPGSTVTRYIQDWGRGYLDVSDLNPGLTYSIRVATFMGDRSALPKESVVRVEPFRTFHGKKATKPAKPVDETARAQNRAADPILREAQMKQNMRFASHGDYLRYMAAKTRAEEH